MSEELKTLKDIEEDLLKSYKEVGDEDNFTFPTEELKAAAVKWVKELSNKECKHIKVGEIPVTITSYISEEARAVFMHFFNLTEEDLENE